jgi:hypothetical protein
MLLSDRYSSAWKNAFQKTVYSKAITHTPRIVVGRRSTDLRYRWRRQQRHDDGAISERTGA